MSHPTSTSTSGNYHDLMEELLKKFPVVKLPELGSLVEGVVIYKLRNKVLVDLDGINTGIISGREAHDSSETFRELQEGSEVQAVVIDNESPEGLIILSLRKASQEKTWNRFIHSFEDSTTIEVVPNEANKGGLLLEIDGIKGFIPVSQLAPLHYPRVNGSDSSKIQERLEKLVGQTFKTKILNIDRDNGKLILSEKSAYEEERRQALGKLKVGQKVQGKISGIVNFGIFVAFENLEGLVHISEIAWGHVSDPNEYGKLGDTVEILVIGIDGEKISLSMKRLTPDPWIEAAKTFKVGKMVEGAISRITQFGAFIKLNEEINGLIHLSEITNEDVSDINKHLQIGQKVKAKIITVDLDEHRIGLSIKAIKKESASEAPSKTPSKKETSSDSEVSSPPASDLTNLGLSEKIVKVLHKNGIDTVSKLKDLDPVDLQKIKGIGSKTAEKILSQLKP